MNTSTTVTIEIDTTRLSGYGDRHLAALWHVAQANPAPHGDRAAGELADTIGYEIIRRWLAGAEPELYHHQARDHYWDHLQRLGSWDSDGVFTPNHTPNGHRDGLAGTAPGAVAGATS